MDAHAHLITLHSQKADHNVVADHDCLPNGRVKISMARQPPVLVGIDDRRSTPAMPVTKREEQDR
jgi:hypothetical protein